MEIRRFIRKVVLFIMPFILLIGLYFILDPFKVLYSYDSYFDEQVRGTVFLNTDYVATANLENRYPELKYNSFIFGNSRAWFYRISDWQDYIGNEPAYHFDAAGETLWAMHKKFLYLDRHEIRIKNALIVMDHSILSKTEPKTGHLGVISPPLVENKNWFDFHVASLTGFLNIQFLFAYLDFEITGRLKPYMQKNNLLEGRPFSYDASVNELSFDYYDKLIQQNSYFKGEIMEEFYEREGGKKWSPPAIGAPQQEMLEEMAWVLRKHQTRFRIIISPLYNQEYLANEDLMYLKSLFGSQNVFDFSGVNTITADYRNYYEKSHYRPPVAGQLLRQVYRQDLQLSYR